MGNPLVLFPARVAIGRTDTSGAVYMTPEFSRALADLLARIGGPNGSSTEDMAFELATLADPAGMVLAQRLEHMEHQLAQAEQLTARLAELRKQVAALEAQLVGVAPPTDWEHPGKIGAAKANSGKFTTLDAAGKATFNPAGQSVELKPTGTGTVTIQPATAGAIDNMTLGATTAKPASVTTLATTGLASMAGGVKFTGPATLPAAVAGLMSYEAPVTRFYVGDATGYSFRFSKRAAGVTSDLVTIDDYGSLSIAWKFGCNGKAPQPAAASGGTLAGVISALVANGILSS